MVVSKVVVILGHNKNTTEVIYNVLIMFTLTLLQNASYTLMSRARNSRSILYNGLASVASNGIYLLIIRKVVTNLDNVSMMLAYLIGAVTGSISMHWIAIKFLEKSKSVNK